MYHHTNSFKLSSSEVPGRLYWQNYLFSRARSCRDFFFSLPPTPPSFSTAVYVVQNKKTKRRICKKTKLDHFFNVVFSFFVFWFWQQNTKNGSVFLLYRFWFKTKKLKKKKHANSILVQTMKTYTDPNPRYATAPLYAKAIINRFLQVLDELCHRWFSYFVVTEHFLQHIHGTSCTSSVTFFDLCETIWYTEIHIRHCLWIPLTEWT